MSLLKQVNGCCFAQKCGVTLFDIDNEESMKNQLDYQWDHLPYGGYGPGPGYYPPRRYFYDAATNRCFCPEHGRELLLLRTSLPLAVQELAALSLLSSSIIISKMQDAINRQNAINRVERLRIAESMLLPIEVDTIARTP